MARAFVNPVTIAGHFIHFNSLLALHQNIEKNFRPANQLVLRVGGMIKTIHNKSRVAIIIPPKCYLLHPLLHNQLMLQLRLFPQ
jgi:hypothetical protein